MDEALLKGELVQQAPGPSQQTTTGTSGSPGVIQQATNYIWAQTVLQNAGLPTTPNNVLNITRWMVSEEPASNWYNNNNPLNINSLGNGSDSFPSLTASAAETANYLALPTDTGIRAALAANAPFPQFEAAVVASPWASGHYNGALFSGTPATVQAGTGIQLTPGSGGSADLGSTAPAGTCGAGSKGIQIDALKSVPLIGSFAPSVTIFNACQVKAIAGGLLVGLGAVVMLAGAVLVVSNTKAGKTAVAAAGAIGGGPVGKVAAGISSGAKRVTPSGREAAYTERQRLRAPEAQAENEEIAARNRPRVVEAKVGPSRRLPRSQGAPDPTWSPF